MTIKELKGAGFKVEKTGNRSFTISNETSKKIKIEKVTDTKFRYKDNPATPYIEVLLDHINNEATATK